MAWKVTCVMDQRLEFETHALETTNSMSNLCMRFGISRKTGYKWLNRFL